MLPTHVDVIPNVGQLGVVVTPPSVEEAGQRRGTRPERYIR
jgi:hypothetical protein